MIKELIFEYFGSYEKEIDPNQISGKGILQRYNEALAEDMDEELIPEVEDLLENTVFITTCYDRYVVNLEQGVGNELYILNDLEVRRKIQRQILRYYEVRGSVRGYRIMLGLLGFDVEVTVNRPESGFDSSLTFDSEARTFDSGCPKCFTYSLDLTRQDGGSDDLSEDEIESVLAVVRFNEPMRATLVGLYQEGELIPTDEDFNDDFNDDFL